MYIYHSNHPHTQEKQKKNGKLKRKWRKNGERENEWKKGVIELHPVNSRDYVLISNERETYTHSYYTSRVGKMV